ncbi:MAG TPA: hypothetical protein V6C81_21295 [Planktothrix sp.]|jgi:hypothetical protein
MNCNSGGTLCGVYYSSRGETPPWEKRNAPSTHKATNTSPGYRPSSNNTHQLIGAPHGVAGSFVSAPAKGFQVDASIDSQLEQLELKMYGSKQDKLSIIKRIEKLETDTSGAPKQGLIVNRVSALRKQLGP